VAKRDPESEILQCSFCEKSQHDVRKIIAGPSVYICDECVEACVEIIADDKRSTGGTPVAVPSAATPLQAGAIGGLVVRCSLCKMPLPIEDALPIPSRGALCPGCVGEIQAAAAERAGEEC
jgi:hypothetical protein